LEKKQERALFKNRIISASAKKGRRKKETATRKSVRTLVHDRHLPDLPFGEITIEVTSIEKHCTTTKQRKVEG